LLLQLINASIVVELAVSVLSGVLRRNTNNCGTDYRISPRLAILKPQANGLCENQLLLQKNEVLRRSSWH